MSREVVEIHSHSSGQHHSSLVQCHALLILRRSNNLSVRLTIRRTRHTLFRCITCSFSKAGTVHAQCIGAHICEQLATPAGEVTIHASDELAILIFEGEVPR